MQRPIYEVVKKLTDRGFEVYIKCTKTYFALLLSMGTAILTLLRAPARAHLLIGSGLILLLLLFGNGARANVPEKEFKAFVDEVEVLKKSDVKTAIQKVNDYQKEQLLSDDQTLQLHLFKVIASIRDQFNFNYPKLLREYLLEAKYLNNQKHIYISKRMLFIFYLFNQTGEASWLREGLRYFEEQQDTAQMAQTYSVFFLHHVQNRQYDSAKHYVDLVVKYLDFIAKKGELSKLLLVPCQYYGLYSDNDSLYNHYKSYALSQNFIGHPKDSLYLLHTDIYMHIKHAEWDAIPGMLKKAFRLCSDSSYHSAKQRYLFLNMQRYYYQTVDSLEKALEVAYEYQTLTEKMNANLYQGFTGDLMNGELLTSLEVNHLQDQQEKKALTMRMIIITVSAVLVLIALFVTWQARKKVLKQKVLQERQEKELLEMKLLNENLEREKMEQTLENSKKDVLLLTSNLKQKSQLLYELRDELKSVKQKSEVDKEIDGIISKVTASGTFSSDWDSIYERYVELNPNFFNELSKQGRNLSIGELKLCALISLNFSNEEISEIMHIESRSVVTKKHRLKKKLGLEKDHNLNEHLRAF